MFTLWTKETRKAKSVKAGEAKNWKWTINVNGATYDAMYVDLAEKYIVYIRRPQKGAA